MTPVIVGTVIMAAFAWWLARQWPKGPPKGRA